VGRFARWILAAAAAVTAVALQDAKVVAAVAVAVSLLCLPRIALPAAAVVFARGLGIPALSEPLSGQLRLTDLCLILFVLRAGAPLLRGARSQPAHVLAGSLFLAWSFAVTMAQGVSATPLLRLAVYLVAGYCVMHSPDTRRLLERAVVGYACVELLLTAPALPGRLYGATVNDPAQFGGLMLVAALVVWLRWRPGPLRLLTLCYLAAGVVFSQTRSVWFAAAAVTAVLVLRARGRLMPVAVPAVGVLIGLPLIPWITNTAHLSAQSTTLRVESMRLGMAAFRAHPFAGQGWAYHAATGPHHLAASTGAYNVWIFVAASTGLVGLLLFAAWLTFLARDLSRGDSVGYAVLTVMLAMGMSEMPIYAGALLTIVFLTLMSPSVGQAP
jgi:hypothetical protein